MLIPIYSKMKKTFLAFILFALCISCHEKKQILIKSDRKVVALKTIEWDFTNKDFPQSDLTFVAEGYNAFSARKIDENTLLLESSYFQGWKNKAANESDTLILRSKIFEKDAKGNILSQKLTYNKDDEVTFELNVTHTYISEADSMTINPKLYFNYNGKLKVNKKNRQYVNDDLWYK